MKLTYWDRFLAGTAPIIIGVFCMGSIQLFFTGLLGEYILNNNTRIMKRPLVISCQFHNQRSEVWTIISGEGLYAFNGVVYRIKPGDVLNIPIGAKHALRAVTELEFIEVQMGSGLVEEDIVRIYMTWTWEEVEEHCTW